MCVVGSLDGSGAETAKRLSSSHRPANEATTCQLEGTCCPPPTSSTKPLAESPSPQQRLQERAKVRHAKKPDKMHGLWRLRAEWEHGVRHPHISVQSFLIGNPHLKSASCFGVPLDLHKGTATPTVAGFPSLCQKSFGRSAQRNSGSSILDRNVYARDPWVVNLQTPFWTLNNSINPTGSTRRFSKTAGCLACSVKSLPFACFQAGVFVAVVSLIFRVLPQTP